MSNRIAAIDVHKKLLAVVVAEAGEDEPQWQVRRFGTGAAEAVMEPTAQYWKPVWLALEAQMRLHLAQARPNRAPKGRKTDVRDAERLWKRFVAGEMRLSFVRDAGQRDWRLVTRTRLGLVGARVQVRNQLESLLEKGGIKLSSVASDLLGVSGRRILEALARGETHPEALGGLGEATLRCGCEALADAVTGRMSPVHCALLGQHLDRIALLDGQIEQLSQMAAAQDLVAEVGPEAASFATAGQTAAWTGVCPGSQQSAGHNASGRSPKGTPTCAAHSTRPPTPPSAPRAATSSASSASSSSVWATPRPCEPPPTSCAASSGRSSTKAPAMGNAATWPVPAPCSAASSTISACCANSATPCRPTPVPHPHSP